MDMQSFRVRQSKDKSGKLIRVDKCLYRLSSTGMYYAVFRHEGKLHRLSLESMPQAHVIFTECKKRRFHDSSVACPTYPSRSIHPMMIGSGFFSVKTLK